MSNRTPIVVAMLLLAALVVYSNTPSKLELIVIDTKCRTYDGIVVYYPSSRGKCLPQALSWYTRSR